MGFFDMYFFDPSVQDRVHGTVGAGSADTITPLLSAPGTILWLVFAGGLLIFLSIIYLIMRGRVASAARYAEAADEKFFQPAGDEAEITFDEEERAFEKQALQQEIAPAIDDDVEQLAIEEIAEVTIERPDIEAESAAFIDTAEQSPKHKKKRRGFSGLFSKLKKRSEENELAEIEESVEAELIETNGAMSEAEPDFEIDRSDPFAKMRGSLEFESDENNFLKKQKQDDALEVRRRAQEEAETIRRKAEEDARQVALEAEENARRVAAEEARLAAEREADFERRKQTLLQQQSAQAQPHDIEHTLSRELDDHFAALSEKLEKQAQENRPAPSAAPAFVTGSAEPSALNADLITQKFIEHREAVDTALSSINTRLNQIAGAPTDLDALRTEIADLRGALSGRVGPPSAPLATPSVQLSDIVRNALPPDSYEMNAILPNNRKADCVIRLPHPPGPVAIDARFPVEAYDKLQRALSTQENDEAAENEFRRVTLRHVVDIAERMIVPDETAESALMFIPSESIYTELHVRFPDVVQDSYRARVWIVSPTTLMATLHTIRAIVRDANARENADMIQAEAQQVLGEVEDLRRRVITLEETFDRTRSDVRDVISSTDQVYRRAETITRGGRSLADDQLDHDRRPESPATPARPETLFSSPEPGRPISQPSVQNPVMRPNEPDLWETEKSKIAETTPFPLR